MAQLNLNTVKQNIEPKGLATKWPAISNYCCLVINHLIHHQITSFIQCLIEFTGSIYITLGSTSSSTNSQTGIITFNIFTSGYWPWQF